VSVPVMSVSYVPITCTSNTRSVEQRNYYTTQLLRLNKITQASRHNECLSAGPE